jgi:hypothetical protein
MDIPNPENRPADRTPSPLEVDKIGELLKELCITRSNLNLYSFDHSVSRQSLKDTLLVIMRILEGREQIVINITKTALLFEGLAVEERNPMVATFARDLRELRVNGFSFKKGIALKELAVFFKLLTLKKAEVERLGGARVLLSEMGVEHIGINQVRYVRLDDDKKIVSKGAHVLAARQTGEQSSERELVDDLVKALTDKQADREWLLEEVRTDPARVANQIVALIKYFDDQDMMGHQEQRQEAMESLLGSIKTLGIRMAERDGVEEIEDGDKSMATSMMILERELKSRSAGLKSSKAVTRFVEEMTSTVTAFIDNHQANRVVKEYLKDEKGLKRTEQLLRSVMQRGSEASSVQRIESLLLEKGLSEKDLAKLVNRLFPDPKAAEEKKKKRKPRKPRAPRPVMKKIEKALAEKLDTINGKEETAAYLSGLFQREVGVRLKEVKEDRVRLAAEIKRVDEMLSATGLGLVALDKDGMVIMITRPAASVLGEGGDQSLPPALIEFITAGQTDSFPDRTEFLNRQPPEDRDRFLRILEAIDHPIMSKDGELLGLILKGT